jgi:hydrogenase expression/formation protein HypE
MAGHSLPPGKLDPQTLKQLVFSHLGSKDSRVLLGPGVGEDATVIDFGDKALLVHSDPITGAVENMGWLAVNVCANDIATRGVKPRWMLIVILLPEEMKGTRLKDLISQIDQAAKTLGIAIVGGHSEVTSSIKHPILVTTAIGEASKNEFVKTSGARPGDALIVTKGAAIEGAAILASDMADLLEGKVARKSLEKAKQFIKMTSVVEDALTAVEAAEIHAMHDTTEGGIASGLQEIAWASNVGVIAHEDRIPIHPETEAICRTLHLDPLKTISSGALLIATEPKEAKKVLTALKSKRIKASIIGKVTEDAKRIFIVRKDGTKLNLTKPVKEELWKALSMRH